jgi:hypothetical protein
MEANETANWYINRTDESIREFAEALDEFQISITDEGGTTQFVN